MNAAHAHFEINLSGTPDYYYRIAENKVSFTESRLNKDYALAIGKTRFIPFGPNATLLKREGSFCDVSHILNNQVLDHLKDAARQLKVSQSTINNDLRRNGLRIKDALLESNNSRRAALSAAPPDEPQVLSADIPNDDRAGSEGFRGKSPNCS